MHLSDENLESSKIVKGYLTSFARSRNKVLRAILVETLMLIFFLYVFWEKNGFLQVLLPVALAVYLLLLVIPLTYTFRKNAQFPRVLDVYRLPNSIQITFIRKNGHIEKQHLSIPSITKITLVQSYPAKYNTFSLFEWQDFWYIKLCTKDTEFIISSIIFESPDQEVFGNYEKEYVYLPAP